GRVEGPARSSRRAVLPAHTRLSRHPPPPLAHAQAARDPDGSGRDPARRADGTLEQQARAKATAELVGVGPHSRPHVPGRLDNPSAADDAGGAGAPSPKSGRALDAPLKRSVVAVAA